MLTISTTQPTQSIGDASTQSMNSLVNSFKSGNGLILLCCLIAFIALSVLGDGKKGKRVHPSYVMSKKT